MMRSAVLLSAAGLACGSAHVPLDCTPLAFERWAQRHQKVYASRAEELRRFGFFCANAAAIDAVAAAAPLATYSATAFDSADRSPAELAAQRAAGDRPWEWSGATPRAPFSDAAVAAALDPHHGTLDWVTRGAVTPPLNQGRCATCAQFSATANIEAQWFLAGHALEPLAVQEMIDCSSYTGPYGMGWVSDVHKGLDRARDYPLANHSDPTLKGCRSSCNATAANMSFAHIDGAECLSGAFHDNETQMMAWIQHGPLSVSVAAGAFNGYKGGIITGEGCNTTQVDHAVLLVAYGEDIGMPYWTLKNSWGPEFGEGGYVKIQRGNKCIGLRGACQAYIGAPPPSV